jgi:hypothetical protein
VVEQLADTGEVKRTGDCLLGVWPAPLEETDTCDKYVRRGMVATTIALRPTPSLRQATPRRPRADSLGVEPTKTQFELPEDLLAMDADEFRNVLREVIREELGVAEVELGQRWRGGELILKPGKESTQEKRVPIEHFFHKVVMIRDKLRVLEQRINASAGLGADDKIQLQQYITQCYGTLTTFNVLFAEKDDGFVGQKSD